MEKLTNNLGIHGLVNSFVSARAKIRHIKDFLIQKDREKWYNELFNDRNLENGNKLRTYRQYKTTLCTSSYVKLVKYRDQRRILANFRGGSLPLSIETGRYTRPKTPIDDRICKYCNSGCVEDDLQ